MKFLALAPEWVSKSFPIIRYVFMFLIAAAAITLIVATLMQDTKEGGENAITGVQESYYSQNKGQTKEGILKKITIAMASIIAILIVLFFVTILIENAF
jgi:preprotein translocase subunit SecG